MTRYEPASEVARLAGLARSDAFGLDHTSAGPVNWGGDTGWGGREGIHHLLQDTLRTLVIARRCILTRQAEENLRVDDGVASPEGSFGEGGDGEEWRCWLRHHIMTRVSISRLVNQSTLGPSPHTRTVGSFDGRLEGRWVGSLEGATVGALEGRAIGVAVGTCAIGSGQRLD
jgi:hypothetical protein